MPTRLISFIVTLLIIVTFIGFNIENSSDIRIWFGEKGLLTDVPIFVSFFIMYLIGVLSVIPFLLSWKRKKRHREKEKSVDSENSSKSIVKKVRVLGGRKKTDAENDVVESTDSGMIIGDVAHEVAAHSHTSQVDVVEEDTTEESSPKSRRAKKSAAKDSPKG